MSARSLVVVSGSGSRIGQAIVERLASVNPASFRLVTLSRTAPAAAITQAVSRHSIEHEHRVVDLQRPEAVEELQGLWKKEGLPDRVFACNGILHDEKFQPEKSIRSFDSEFFLKSMQANVVTHAHLAKSLHSSVNSKQAVRWVSLSAKVASATDNTLGGWHSYRMSKTALNMLIRNLDIEWRRKNALNRIAAVHPGMTDSPLSKPFQAGVKEIFTPELTAERMVHIMENLTESQSGKLLYYDGKEMPF